MHKWDGTSPSRKSLDFVKAPDHDDYIKMVAVIQQLQEFVQNLSQNVEIMPNLEEMFQSAYEQLKVLYKEIELVSLPEDLMNQLVDLEKKLEEIDCTKEVLKLKQSIEALKNIVANNQLKVLQLQNDFATEVKGFQNRVWSTLTSLQKVMTDKVTTLEQRVDQLSTQVDIANLLGRLQK